MSVGQTYVRARIDQKTKDEAAAVLEGMGLNLSDAIRLLMMRIAEERRLPFDVNRPNAITIKAMEAADRGEGKRFNSAEELFEDLGI